MSEGPQAPLFEVLLELHNDTIVFVPSLELDVEQLQDAHSFFATVSGLLEDITHMGIQLPRISYHRNSYTYMVRSTIDLATLNYMNSVHMS